MCAVSTARPSSHSVGFFAVVLGTNEIASAVGVYLQRDGWSVVLAHDPHPPVMRRTMAFHDVLFGDPAEVDGVLGAHAGNGLQVLKVLAGADRIAVTWLSPLDVLAIRSVDLLVDARMQKHRVTPDLRRLARLTIGLGPCFAVNSNCDIAVETRPAKNGAIVRNGKTDDADGVARRLGDVGAERFVYSSAPGCWRTSVEIGASIIKESILGHLNGLLVRAPFDGILRGIVRDGTDVPAGIKLLEVDPRGPDAQWTGMDERGRTIAKATLNAIRIHAAQQQSASLSTRDVSSQLSPRPASQPRFPRIMEANVT